MKLSKMLKEELELLSYTKIAEMYLKENKVHLTTAGLFKEVCKLLELSDAEYEAKLVDFFQGLTTSKEFILLEDGTWDLKANHAVKVAINEIYEDEDEDFEKPVEEELEEESEDKEESIEYDPEAEEDDFEEDELEDLAIVDESELED